MGYRGHFESSHKASPRHLEPAGGRTRASYCARSSNRLVRRRTLVAHNPRCVGCCSGSAWIDKRLGGIAAEANSLTSRPTLKKEKPFPPLHRTFVGNFGNKGQRVAFECRERVVDKKRLRGFFPKLRGDQIEGWTQHERP